MAVHHKQVKTFGKTVFLIDGLAFIGNVYKILDMDIAGLCGTGP
jgi:hypothetical protein